MSVAPLIHVEIDLRCAYCGLDHKIRVVVRQMGSELVPTAYSASEGCDVMDWRTVSIIEPG